MTEEEKRGAPEGNENAVKHGLFRQDDKLRENLTDQEERMLVEIASDLLDRFPEDADIGAYERASIEQISLDALKRQKANHYIIKEDLVTDTSEQSDIINRVYSRIVGDTTKELEKLGLLREGPAHKSAEASEGWMEAISEATEDADD